MNDNNVSTSIKKPSLWSRFRAWRIKKSIEIDHWSRKKPFRRKMYLNRSLYAMMAPYLIMFTCFTVAPVVMSFMLG
ncbi:MAG TPA: hypothetical protein PLO88_00715, partial [Bacilli bacterium]|nr:hypothetical protein [Bacilli bacterium]